ncbi:MAG: SDR family oxidoreductase [Oscillibacter sp.]|nr:SDR family oxidoreductase [Oscillibacter sp.]
MEKLFDLTGKKAIVTGASRKTGLCFAQAQALRKAGAEVVLMGGSPENLAQMEKMTGGANGYHIVYADLLKSGDRERAFQESMRIFGGQLDILVNGAGAQHRCPAAEFPPEQWERLIGVNLSAMFYLCQLAGRVMLRQGSGKIINIASVNSFLGGQIVPAYAASKGGVVQLTKALSNEWMPYGIQVNAIAPGFMETELSRDRMVSALGAEITKRIPARRWGKPEDLQGLTIFLASRASDYVSGTVIQADGGYLAN